MIQDPLAIVTILLVIEGAIFFLSERPALARFFDIVPSMFWIYFLPLLATTFGLLPDASPVYTFASRNFLPASLILLLLAVDIRGILRLGRVALTMMLAGSVGIVLGGPLVLLAFRSWLPDGIWAGFGPLSASWTGGSANMVAVKEGMHTPDRIYTLMVVLDSIIPYVWMAFLMAVARYQTRFDQWNRSRTAVMDELNRRTANLRTITPRPLTTKAAAVIFAVAFVGTLAAATLAARLPEIKGAIGTYTWTILLATSVGILFSLTPLCRLESYGASRFGFAILYFVLATYGARASLTDIRALPILLAAALLWVIIHGLFTFAAARLLRAPMFLAVAASQANLGGVASAPVVAEAYQPALASVGLLLAIFGNIIGTYLGILCGQLCKWVSGS